MIKLWMVKECAKEGQEKKWAKKIEVAKEEQGNTCAGVFSS